ncbi:MAG: T9SS type A sorting domain-containing protein [Bacteroidota bacterium]
MKKLFLLTIVLILALSASSQKGYIRHTIQPANPKLSEIQATPDGILMNSGFPSGLLKSTSSVVIGDTWYDTQTYNSGNLMTHLYEHSDGKIGSVWMHMGQNSTPDRGTAYNFYNGSAWGQMAPHLGSDPKDGFPCYAPWGDNGEIICHYQYIAGTGPLKILRRTVKGTGTWQESVLNPPAGNHSLVWQSMITSGTNHQFVHILALLYDDPYQGQDDALLYYRSSDGGVTWDIPGVVIDGLGSAYFLTISSLKYSWAQPVGNTIAFTYGFDQFDGLLFKSMDNGTTWQKTVVYQSPYDPFTVPDQTPTYGCGDGTSAVALDSQGNAHIVFGRMLRFHDVVSTPPGGWYYYPISTEGLIYWNESMPPLDSTIVSTFTLDSLRAHGNLIAWVVPDTGTINIPTTQPNYGVGLTSMPQLGIDAQDNLFLVYAAVAPLYGDGINYFRHIYGNASFDGGATWNGITDLTSDIYFFFSECVYPALSPLVNNKVHVMFQEDYTPGTGSGEENFMEYLNFPKEYFVGINREPTNAGFTVSQNFPNPTKQKTGFIVTTDKQVSISVEIRNLFGEVQTQPQQCRLNQGKNNITLDLNGLVPGIYLCTFDSGSGKLTRKIIIQ